MKFHHCVKSVRIQSFSGPYFPAVRLNTERYGVPLRIQYKCGKIRSRKTPNTDPFHAVQTGMISHLSKRQTLNFMWYENFMTV